MYQRQSLLTGLVVLVLVVAGGTVSPVAAQPFPIPFADPARMLDVLFGEENEVDREALESIEVSIVEERELGQQVLKAGLASLKEAGIPVVRKGRDVEYLKSLVDTLRPFLRHPDRYPRIEVLVARSPRVDARSCPGGTLIFFEGLLDQAGSEAALVGIVGHELSHLDHGHQLLPIRRIKWMQQTAKEPQTLARLMHSGPALTRLWARPFRPEDERAADADGAAWAYAAGYDPRELARLFEPRPDNPVEAVPWEVFLKTHPTNSDRHAAILRQAQRMEADQPPSEPLFLGRENLKNRYSRRQAEQTQK